MGGCSTKPCPKLYNGFTLYEQPPSISFKGKTNLDLRRDLKKAVVKLRTQTAILDSYENDIARYNKYKENNK